MNFLKIPQVSLVSNSETQNLVNMDGALSMFQALNEDQVCETCEMSPLHPKASLRFKITSYSFGNLVIAFSLIVSNTFKEAKKIMKQNHQNYNQSDKAPFFSDCRLVGTVLILYSTYILMSLKMYYNVLLKCSSLHCCQISAKMHSMNE